MGGNTHVFKVLIVEDIDSMRHLLRELLDGQEMSRSPEPPAMIEVIAVARNIWEARTEMLRNRPDLILLDEVLPGESSLDFLEEIRAEGIACVLLTSMSERQAPVPPGASGRLSKPGERGRADDRRILIEALSGLVCNTI